MQLEEKDLERAADIEDTEDEYIRIELQFKSSSSVLSFRNSKRSIIVSPLNNDFSRKLGDRSIRRKSSK